MLFPAASRLMNREGSPFRRTFRLERRVLREGRALKRALARGQLEVHYQPIVSLVGPNPGRVGAEALLRWPRAHGDSTPPSQFIPLAEETGLINELGRYVISAACRQLKSWLPVSGNPGFFMSINLSPRQLTDDDTLIGHIAQCIDLHRLDPSSLMFELTESAVMSDPQLAKERITAMRGLGVRVVIDDFGTGHSSLAMLHDLPVDVLKIDQCFVANITEGSIASSLVRMMIELAHQLGCVVVAEGVEKHEQAAALSRLDCDLAQGYLFGAPAMPHSIVSSHPRIPSA